MAEPMPEHPMLSGGYAPIQMECDIADLIVEGEVPSTLNGTFFRNGPNPQYAPRGSYHWFGGDGMVHAFQIQDGRVSYKNRWARTVKWKKEREAGRSLFGAMNPLDRDDSVQGLETDGLANTNIIWHGNKLLALEEGHAPFELNPHTLESIGPCTYADKLKGPMTAHPKIDPETGEMLFFGYNVDGALSKKMSFHVVDREGNLTRSEFFDAPFPSMVHDFITTKDYIIFPIMPLTGSLDRAMKGLPVYAWEPEKGSHVGIMPRSGTVEDIRWFTSDAAFVFHPMNAFENDGVITCDVCQFGQAPMFPFADGRPGDPAKSFAQLTRWTMDLSKNTNTYEVDLVDDRKCEFPRLDERRAGLNYRFGYMACDSRPKTKGGLFNSIARVDHQTGKIQMHELPLGHATNEPVFVPTHESSGEGEGVLLTNVYDANKNSSYLLILDAENVDSDPLALVNLDHRVPFGFHGNWMPAQ